MAATLLMTLIQVAAIMPMFFTAAELPQLTAEAKAWAAANVGLLSLIAPSCRAVLCWCSTSPRAGSRACSTSASPPPARSERRATVRASCRDHGGATVIGHRWRLVSAPAVGIQMKSILHHPATILAALGAVSGTLGSYRPRRQLRRRPRARPLHGLRRTVVRPRDRLRPVALGRSFVAHRGDRRRGHVDRLGSWRSTSGCSSTSAGWSARPSPIASRATSPDLPRAPSVPC